MRLIARFEKGESVRFVSHLDVQRLFQRAFRRADIPMMYSSGFNPHPLLSFATALTVGATSCAEWLDLHLEREMPPEQFLAAVNAELPAGFRPLEAQRAPEAEENKKKPPTLTALMAAAQYTILFKPEPSHEALEQALRLLLDGPVVVTKHTKAGLRQVDIRPQVLSASAEPNGSLSIVGQLDVNGGLSVDLLMKHFCAQYNPGAAYRIHRGAIYSLDGMILPKMPEMA